MTFGKKVECVKCERKDSIMWHQVEDGVHCNECVESERLKVKEEEEVKQKSSVSPEKTKPKKTHTRYTRSYKTRQNPNALPKQVTPKGKGRRNIFKKVPPVKLQSGPPSFRIVKSVLHKGTFYRVGDVVSLIGSHDGLPYYAQISNLMVDDYCGKSASITWLVPTGVLRDRVFRPLDYVAAYPDDDLPRSLDSMQFVMHSPLEYFRNNNPPPYDLPHPGMAGYIWGRIPNMF